MIHSYSTRDNNNIVHAQTLIGVYTVTASFGEMKKKKKSSNKTPHFVCFRCTNILIRLSGFPLIIISHNVRLSVPLSTPDLHFRNWAAPQ